MIPYLLLIPSVLLSVANTLLLRNSNAWGLRRTGDLLLFNASVSAVWTLLMAIWSAAAQTFRPDRKTILFGLIYACILCAFQYFRMRATATGPVSLTTLIACCAFIPVVLYSVAVYGEKPGACRIVGIVGLTGSLALSLLKPAANEKPRLGWGIFCVLFFAAGTGAGILYLEFGRSDVAGKVNEMFLTASFFSTLFFLLLAYLTRSGGHFQRPSIPRKAIPFVFLCGIAGCLYTRVNIMLSAQIPSAVFFPVFNGCSILFATLGGILFYHEKPTGRQTVGIVLGMAFIFIIGCGDLLLSRL